MTERVLYIGKWTVTFFFEVEPYDEEVILETLYEMDADYGDLMSAHKIMSSWKDNLGFTYGNTRTKEAIVFIGPTSSGAEFIDTLVHEVHHVAVIIADSLGIDLESETPAYIAGDSSRELAEVICRMGCDKCHSKKAN